MLFLLFLCFLAIYEIPTIKSIHYFSFARSFFLSFSLSLLLSCACYKFQFLFFFFFNIYIYIYFPFALFRTHILSLPFVPNIFFFSFDKLSLSIISLYRASSELCARDSYFFFYVKTVKDSSPASSFDAVSTLCFSRSFLLKLSRNLRFTLEIGIDTHKVIKVASLVFNNCTDMTSINGRSDRSLLITRVSLFFPSPPRVCLHIRKSRVRRFLDRSAISLSILFYVQMQ